MICCKNLNCRTLGTVEGSNRANLKNEGFIFRLWHWPFYQRVRGYSYELALSKRGRELKGIYYINALPPKSQRVADQEISLQTWQTR